MIYQLAADICAVLDLIGKRQMRAFDPQFFLQAPCCAVCWRFLPIGMCAAGIRPQAGVWYFFKARRWIRVRWPSIRKTLIAL